MIENKICYSCHKPIADSIDRYNTISSTVYVSGLAKVREEFVLCDECMDTIKEIIRLNSSVANCPKDCTFDWVEFHKLLDIAVAHMIEDMGWFPSHTKVSELLAYSYKKVPKGGTRKTLGDRAKRGKP